MDNLYKSLTDEGLIFIKCKSIDDDLYGKGEKIGEDLYNYGHLRHFFDFADDKIDHGTRTVGSAAISTTPDDA